MEKTVRLQIPVGSDTHKALKLLSTACDSSVAELVRVAIETQYGDRLRDIERRVVRSLSDTANKETLK